MKFEFHEGKFSGLVILIAETPEEAAQLLRLTHNAKIVPVDISTSFNEGISTCIYMQKVDPKVQHNYIKQKGRK